MDHALRRRRAGVDLATAGLDTLLVTHMPNVRYLTGFSGSSARLVLGRSEARLLVDGRYEEQAAHESPDIERRTCLEGYFEAVVEAARALGRRMGFEQGSLSYAEWERLAHAADDLDLAPTTGVVERLREVKDDEERALIASAQRTADAAFEAVVLGGGVRDGVSEREVAFALELAMRRTGAEGPAFDPIVAFGENTAEPHHHPTQRPLRHGDVIKLDFGAEVGGYRSDMTRTVVLGEPDARTRELHELVSAAHDAGVAAVGEGVAAADVDRAARSVIAAAGLGDAFSHPVGHGVGLEIHEAPIMRATCEVSLQAGAVVTVEPGVYLPGVGGVRIEDMVEVTTDGRRVIPRTSKELIVL